MQKPDGGPAYPYTAPPHPYDDQNGGQFTTSGMTMRQHYAALAMAAIISAKPNHREPDGVASLAWRFADEMIKAENEG